MGHVPDSYLEWVIENISQKSVCDIAGQVLDERRKLKIYVKDDEDYVRNEFYDAIMDGMDAREFW